MAVDRPGRVPQPSPEEPRPPRGLVEEVQAAAPSAERSFESGTGQPLALLEPGAPDPADHLLRRALARGDPEVVIQLCWNLYSRPLYLRILRSGIPGDQAEDVLQDVFALFHREYELVRGPRLRGWLWRIADYECLRHFRTCQRWRRNREAVSVAAESMGGAGLASPPDVLADHRCGLRAALDFMEQLSPFEEAVVETSIFEASSTEEVLAMLAARFGRQIDRKELARQRHRLRKQLAEHLARWRANEPTGEHP